MKMKFYKLALALSSAFLCLSAYSGIPNNDNPTTFLGPTLKGKFTNAFTDTMAYSLLGEAGLKNFRVGATWGWKLDENQRLKVSADYLYQQITYSFFSGNTDQWVSQESISAAYLYEFLGYDYNPAVGANAYLSHAPSDNLSTVHGTFTNSAGNRQTFADLRRIAGSNAGGISPMVSVDPWLGGRIGLELNYDNVRYDTTNGPGKNATGFGGTIKLNQAITEDVAFGASAAVRQPFNNYAANLSWSNVPYLSSRWTLGIDGDYTAGKESLPNTYDAGVFVNYALDQRCPIVVRSLKDDAKDDLKGETTLRPINDDLLAWTAEPAVYLPQVLAVTDEEVRIPDPCSPSPELIGTIPNQTPGIGTSTFNTAQAFSPSSGLTYSIQVTPTPTGGNSVSINSTTGVVTVVNAGTSQTITATVTARNACGAAATSNQITITYRGIG